MGILEQSIPSESPVQNPNMNNMPDWLNRIVTSLKLSGIKKQLLVHPCVIEGQKALVYQKGLQEFDPEGYERLHSFAQANGFRLKEDQRSSFKPVANDRRRKVMPMMLLGATLFMPQAYANSGHDNGDHGHALEITSPDLKISKNPLSEIGDYDSDEDLVRGLLKWISDNTSFKYQHEHVPAVEHVSSGKMHKIAFGKDLPKALDQKSFQIYGLYNFKEEKVYILDSLDLHSEKGKAILLHELVHYLQYQEGHDQDVSCKNQLESLAYNLEAQYLKQKNERVSFSQQHIDRVSRCA